MDELTRMMLEDLALPWLEEKPGRQVTTITHRHTDIRRRGSLANLDKRRTLLANIKRNASRGVAEVGHLHDDDLRLCGSKDTLSATADRPDPNKTVLHLQLIDVTEARREYKAFFVSFEQEAATVPISA